MTDFFEVAVGPPVTQETVVTSQVTIEVASVAGARGDIGPIGPAGADADAAVLVTSHVEDASPHPAYDDIPSLALWYENRKV